MLLKRVWIAIVILNFFGVILFWMHGESSFATRFDFSGNPIKFQTGSEFAVSMALIVFFFNLLLLSVNRFAAKPGFAQLMNMPNKVHWLENGKIVEKTKELLNIQAVWINFILLAIFAFTTVANLDAEAPKLHPSFFYFLILMVILLVALIYSKTRAGKSKSSSK